MLRALLRVVLAVSGGALASVLVALLEARLVASAAAEARAGRVPLGALALAEIGLLAAPALVLSIAVAALSLLVDPAAPRSLAEYLRPLRSRRRRAAAAAAAPLVVLAVLAWGIGSAHAARRVLQSGSPAESGLSLGVAAVAALLATGALALALVPPTKRVLDMVARGAPWLADPWVTGGAGLALAFGLVALGLATGDTSGVGGVPALGILAVLTRPELDLRPVLAGGVIALGAHVAPIAFARGRLVDARGAVRIGPIVAALLGALLAAGGLGLTVHAATALGVRPAVADAVERFAPLGRVSLAVLRRATDRDRDGHSGRFGGADCDDSDPRINPNALDVPGNGIDEDCSGADTPAEEPAPPEEEVAATPARPARTYNVLLITVDTLRYDLGFAGYPRPVSPKLDELAAKGTVFERAYSLASYTAKSLGPMLIGRYPSETMRDYEHFTTFYPANTFLAERLADAGAYSFAGHCHYYFRWKTGYAQGFDLWDTSAIAPGMADNDSSVTSERLSDLALRLLSRPENVTPAKTDDGGAERRFFAWFHYFDPHAQYVAHDEAPRFALMKTEGVPPLRAIYDGEVWFTDKHIGRVIDYVWSQPWGEDTAILVTADHGEAFGEHGHRTHGRELWEPLVRVPLLLYVPGAPPRRVPVKRSHIDIVPTVLDLMGAPAPKPGELRGESLLQDVFAEPGAPLEERDVYIDMPEGPYNDVRRALITGPSPGTKLIHLGGRRYQLYDLAEDPGEERDLSEEPSKLDPALARLQRFRSRLTEIAVTR